MNSDRPRFARRDTSVQTLSGYDRCYQGCDSPAEVMVKDHPYCLDHGIQRLADAIRCLPNSHRIRSNWHPPETVRFGGVW